MTIEQQIDQAVEDLKSILCQSAKSRQEEFRIMVYSTKLQTKIDTTKYLVSIF